MKQFSWQQHKLAIAAMAVSAVVVIAGVLFLRSLGSRQIVITVEPPDRDEITTFGTIKYVYSQDGKTVREKHIPYANGGMGHQLFREDGTLATTSEDYPVKQGEKEATLKSKATWSADGKKMVEGEVHRPDGSVWFTIKALADDAFEESFYFKDGWKFSSSKRKKGESRLVTTYFHRTGNTWAEEVHEKTQWNSYNEKSLTVFDASGKRQLFRVDQVGYNETVDGFKPSGYGRLVTYFDEAGKSSFRQWCNTWWNSYLQTQGNLVEVHVFDTTTGTVTRTIEVDETNETVKLKTVSYASGAKKVFRDFGSARKLSIEKVMVQGQPKERFFVQGTLSYEVDASGVRTDHEDAEKLYETVDMVYLSRPSEIELRELRTASQAENRGVLGPRDDSDPVKWYLKQ